MTYGKYTRGRFDFLYTMIISITVNTVTSEIFTGVYKREKVRWAENNLS